MRVPLRAAGAAGDKWVDDVTENSGIATILNGTTSIVVTHDLGALPALADISVVAGEDPTNSVGLIWVDTITPTQFTINCESDPGASNLDFGWRVMVL